MRINYTTPARALIAKQVLAVDKEVKEESLRIFSTQDEYLIVYDYNLDDFNITSEITAVSLRALRMSITNLFDFIALVLDTIDAFDPLLTQAKQ